MKYALLLIAAIITHSAWTPGASAQTPDANAQALRRHDVFGRYQQLAWDERDGLPQNTVVALATTRDGYLWVGTYEGAARFDGVRFTRFNPSTTTGIGTAQVTSLLERRDGDLWLATFGGGVSRFSAGRFTQYATRDGLSSNFAMCLLEDRAGTLWIGTDGGGVSAFKDGRFTTYTTAQGLPSPLVRALVDDGSGGLLVGTSQGIARIAGGRVSVFEARADVARANVSAMARASDGSIWVAAMSGGLYRVDQSGVTEYGPRQGFTSDPAESLFADEDGTVWVGTGNEGLFRYAGGRFESYGPAEGLPGVRVPVVAKSADDGLWVGTSGGLVRLRAPRFTLYTRYEGLASDFIGSILQDRDGSVWVETRGGLSRFVNGAFRDVTTDEGVPPGRTRRLAVGADGHLLVYTGAGLARWTGERFVRLAENAGIAWDRVNDVLEERSGTLWVTVLNAGLVRLRGAEVTRLTKKDGLADDSILTLFQDRAGAVWAGSLRGGVSRIADGRITSWSTADGLQSNHVKAFYQDAAGTMWIGTLGGGLARFKDGKIAVITARQGLFNDDIFRILEDADGNLWMNCNTGIWRTSLAQLNDVADGRRASVDSFVYGVADGMLSSEGVGGQLAGSRLRDGSLWFPTTQGIVGIDPRRRDTAPPRVLIEGLTIDRRPIPIDGPVRVTPDQENLEIQYTGLSWSRPQAIKFRYRLTNLDRDWVDAGARRTAYYSHLPPGSYTFHVIADNGEGVWNAAGVTLPIVVLPRLYQTWTFQTVVASSLAGLVWLSWRYRAAQLRRAQAAQQTFSRQLIASEERERQRIAAELHDSLGQNLLVVKNRALLGALAQQDGEARKQFDEIGATVAQTLAEVRTIAYNLRPHHLEQLGLTTTIRAMIEKSAESSGIVMVADLDDLDGVFPPEQEITIYRIIQESVNNIIKHAKAREARIAVRSYEDHVEITVKDDGQGFAGGKASPVKTTASAPDAAAAPGETVSGFGLKGLAERVEMLGGTHTIETAPGRGTTVTVRIGTGRSDAGARRGHRAWRPTSAS